MCTRARALAPAAAALLLALGVVPMAGAQDCLPACPGINETEVCTNNSAGTNGGCNATPPAFVNVSVGQTRCGQVWANTDGNDGTPDRDTDWYLLTAGANGVLTGALNSEAPCVCFIIEDVVPCAPVVVGVIGSATNCTPGQSALSGVVAGTQYVVFVATGNPDGSGIFDGFPCGGGNNDYQVAISLGPPPACGDAGSGDCCVAHGNAACDDLSCCQAVCNVDPFCCDTIWDAACASNAQSICPECGGGCELNFVDNEGEPCGSDNNGGCNSTPPSFNAIDCGDIIVGTSFAAGGTRDTDWHLVAVDTGTLTASLISEFPGVVFLITGIDTCTVAIVATGSANQCASIESISVPVTPGQVVVFVSTGNPDGSGIFEGFPCTGTNTEYQLTVNCTPGTACVGAAGNCFLPHADPGCDFFPCCDIVCDLDPSCCTDTPQQDWDANCTALAAANCDTCELSSNDCCSPSPDQSPGCVEPECCALVCDEDAVPPGDPFCCQAVWEQFCADLASQHPECGNNGCMPLPAAPRLFSDASATTNGHLEVSPDEYGSWSSDTFADAGLLPANDEFKANGVATIREVGFTNGWGLYVPSRNQREILTRNQTWKDVGVDDPSLNSIIVNPCLGVNTNGDGLFDESTSTVRVFGGQGPNNTDLTIDIHNDVDTNTAAHPNVGFMTQTLNITNNSPNPVNFTLVRQVDNDLVFDAGQNFANDQVGTTTNGMPPPLFVRQSETTNAIFTSTVISSPFAADYYGAKNGCTPVPGPPAFGFGTDLQQWNAFGMPATWADVCANVPAGTGGQPGVNGVSGATPACSITRQDASIGLNIPVSLGAGPAASTSVCIVFTYGQATPFATAPCTAPPPSCPGDIDGDGDVDVNDLVAVITNWGNNPANPDADVDGDGDVDVGDLVIVITNWGPC
jgi:hypothetical protein